MMNYLLGPMAPQTFFDDYFGCSPVLLSGHGQNRFDSLFTLSDFNHLLNYGRLTYPQVRVTDRHNTIHKYNLIDDVDRYANNKNDDINRTKLLMAVAGGGTVVFDRIFEHHPELERFVEQLSRETGMRFRANGYFTGADTRGVNPHFDRHDVFAIQLHGSKVWYYKEDARLLSKPMRQQQVPPDDDTWDHVVLRPGDVFYVPRGVWHYTKTVDESSLHLALGCYPLTLGDWLEKVTTSTPEMAELLESYVQSAPGGDSVISERVRLLTDLLHHHAALNTGVQPPASRTLIELD